MNKPYTKKIFGPHGGIMAENPATGIVLSAKMAEKALSCRIRGVPALPSGTTGRTPGQACTAHNDTRTAAPHTDTAAKSHTINYIQPHATTGHVRSHAEGDCRKRPVKLFRRNGCRNRPCRHSRRLPRSAEHAAAHPILDASSRKLRRPRRANRTSSRP